MTNTNRIEAIRQMLNDYDLRTGSRGADNVFSDPEKWLDLAPYFPFYSSAAALLIDARTAPATKNSSGAAPATKSGTRTIFNAVSRIIKSVDKCRDNFRGIFQRGDLYIVCDGYRLLRLHNDFINLPHVENDFNVDRLMEHKGPSSETLPVPTVSELREYIAAEKQKAGRGKAIKPYCLAGYIWVNAQYLIDMIQALPGITIYKPINNVSALYCTSENGDDGILLPCRPQKAAAQAA